MGASSTMGAPCCEARARATFQSTPLAVTRGDHGDPALRDHLVPVSIHAPRSLASRRPSASAHLRDGERQSPVGLSRPLARRRPAPRAAPRGARTEGQRGEGPAPWARLRGTGASYVIASLARGPRGSSPAGTCAIATRSAMPGPMRRGGVALPASVASRMSRTVAGSPHEPWRRLRKTRAAATCPCPRSSLCGCRLGSTPRRLILWHGRLGSTPRRLILWHGRLGSTPRRLILRHGRLLVGPRSLISWHGRLLVRPRSLIPWHGRLLVRRRLLQLWSGLCLLHPRPLQE
jgi:hypothetical protein